MASDMLLYWGSGSGPCWSVMMMLEEKGLQGYESRQISFSDRGQKGEDVMKLNPRGQVPTFKHGDIIVNETMAILDYLQAIYGSTGSCLLPSDPAQMAQVLQRKYEVINIRKKVFEEYLSPLQQGALKDMPEEEVKRLKDEVLVELARWDGFLEKNGDGAHIGGKDFSLADVMFFPQLAFLVRIGFKMAPRFPHLQAYYDQVSKRASVKASSPPHWRGSPNTTQMADL